MEMDVWTEGFNSTKYWKLSSFTKNHLNVMYLWKKPDWVIRCAGIVAVRYKDDLQEAQNKPPQAQLRWRGHTNTRIKVDRDPRSHSMSVMQTREDNIRTDRKILFSFIWLDSSLRSGKHVWDCTLCKRQGVEYGLVAHYSLLRRTSGVSLPDLLTDVNIPSRHLSFFANSWIVKRNRISLLRSWHSVAACLSLSSQSSLSSWG